MWNQGDSNNDSKRQNIFVKLADLESARDASMLAHQDTLSSFTSKRFSPFSLSEGPYLMKNLKTNLQWVVVVFLMYMNLRQQRIITYSKRRCQAPLITTGCCFLHHVHDFSTCWFLCLPTGAWSTWPNGPVSPSDVALAADTAAISCVIRFGKS